MVLARVLAALPCFASTPTPSELELQDIAAIEKLAPAANVRDQPMMHTDLADRLAWLASHQIAAGELNAATETLAKLEHYTEVVERGVTAKSRDVKQAEMMLHGTSRKLHDLLRVSTDELRPRLQSAISHVTAAQTMLLNKLFEK